MLNQAQQTKLLQAAREAIEDAIRESGAHFHTSHDPALHEARGAFVTIHHRDTLRGCIGYIASDRPLIETVRDAAVKAATEDYRFEPLHPEELAELSIEISVLSEPEPVQSIDAIVIGRHGLIVEGQGRRGLLLPQVPTEQHWDRTTFLTNACRKAGLPPDSWQSPATRIYLFTAEVFHEENNLHVV